MEKFYLYGAGVNGISTIKYFGEENIKAIIDSDPKKQGSNFYNIEIISLDEYIRRNDKGYILISSCDYAEEIAKTLEENQIYNYAECPWMQVFFSNCNEVIDKVGLYKYKTLAFYRRNPFAEQIVEQVKSGSKDVTTIFIDENNKFQFPDETPIIITCIETEEIIQFLQNTYPNNQLINLREIYKAQYNFKNKELVKFKDIHKGKRCFIIGNGPSLSYQDLEKLYQNREVCFGVNRIYLAYEFTKWRPDYYVAADNMIIERDRGKINELPGVKFIRHINNMPKWKDNNMIYEFGNIPVEQGHDNFSFDMVKGVYNGCTVIYEAIQIAFYMGFDEMYLLGVDLTTGIRCEDEGAHFYKSPDTKETLGYGNRSFVLSVFKYARQIIENQGRIIRNATRVGEWDEIQKVDFDTLFSSNNCPRT